MAESSVEALSKMTAIAKALGLFAGIEAINCGDIDEEENDYDDLGTIYWNENFSSYAVDLYNTFPETLKAIIPPIDAILGDLESCHQVYYLKVAESWLAAQEGEEYVDSPDLVAEEAMLEMHEIGMGLGLLAGLKNFEVDKSVEDTTAHGDVSWTRTFSYFVEVRYGNFSETTKSRLPSLAEIQNTLRTTSYIQAYAEILKSYDLRSIAVRS